MRFIKRIIAMIMVFIVIMYVFSGPIYADTSLREKAADLNRDGEVTYKDLELIVQMGYPEVKKNGVVKTANSGNYIFRGRSGGTGAIRGSDGEFIYVGDWTTHIQGYYTRTINGELRTFTIYFQDKSFFPGQCNRAAAASIASGYTDDDDATVASIAQSAGDNIGSNQTSTIDYFSQYGLTPTWYQTTTTSFTSAESTIIELLNQDNFVMIWFPCPTVGATTSWTGLYHWIAFLDIEQTGDGGCALFVSSSSGHTSYDNYNYGQGWYDISEFENTTIQYVVGIKEM